MQRPPQYRASPPTLTEGQAPEYEPIGSKGETLVALSPNAGIPGLTELIAGSGNVANASAVATLTPAAGKTAYITGFEVTGSGATTPLPVTVTVVGLLGGTRHYTYTFIAGVLIANTPLIVEFTRPLPASAVDIAIVVTCPASGAGGTNNTVVAHGFSA